MTHKKYDANQIAQQRSICVGNITLLGLWCLLAQLADYLTYTLAVTAWLVTGLLILMQLTCLHRGYDKLYQMCSYTQATNYRIATGIMRKTCFILATALAVTANIILAALQLRPIWLRSVIGAATLIVAYRAALHFSIRPEKPLFNSHH
jgi:hypothetical protein